MNWINHTFDLVKNGSRVVAAVTSLLLVTACSTMAPNDFADREPRLQLESYFSGKVQAWGIFEDRFGNIRRQFVVDIDGNWDGRQLVLDERFLYSDGEKQRRVWKITKVDEHAYLGTADDVIGTARGVQFGNGLNWSYAMMLKVGDDHWKVRFDDWMFLQPGGVIINRAVVLRWGIEIGTVTIAFRRIDPGLQADKTFPAPSGS